MERKLQLRRKGANKKLTSASSNSKCFRFTVELHLDPSVTLLDHTQARGMMWAVVKVACQLAGEVSVELN